jgi:hypothetical protein
MNTFEYYYRHFKKFEDKIISWKPDYIVPVAKKGCKLLKASNQAREIDPSLIKYRNYWLFTPYGDTIMPLCGCNSHI